MFICTLCDTEYNTLPMGGYCDDTMACADDDGEHLIAV